jgi:hypothetical protein
MNLFFGDIFIGRSVSVKSKRTPEIPRLYYLLQAVYRRLFHTYSSKFHHLLFVQNDLVYFQKQDSLNTIFQSSFLLRFGLLELHQD